MVACIDCKNRTFKTHKDKYIMCVIDSEYRDSLRWRDCPHDAFEKLSEHISEMDRFELNTLKVNISVITKKIDQLFDEAIDVKDTVWYSDFETLRDAIIRVINNA